jgi:aspartyl aminopeptidase
MMNHSYSIQDLQDFLDASPTAWHAISTIKKDLEQHGFQELLEQELWSIKPGKSYYVVRNGSSLCAFITPNLIPQRMRLLASHTDSPGLKLKPQPEIHRANSILFSVEIYGSPLLSSWLNRDLGIAGRVIYLDQNSQIQESLVRLDKHSMTIPQLAIHLNREVNEKGLLLNKQEHLNALAALEKSVPEMSSLLEVLLSEKITFSEILTHDLFLFPLEPARLIGFKQTLLTGYRIDSLASVYAALTALLSENKPLENDIKMVVFWDNEEVGSQTSRGAGSPLFSQVVERILNGLKLSNEEYHCLINRSTCISIDLAHAVHPNYIDKHDAEHQPILGGGIVLKNNAQERYATDARSAIPVKMMAHVKNLSLQNFVSRNDMPCGSTIGPLHAAKTGMSTVDIGSPQLSMHSCRELMACQDYLDLCELLGGLFQNPDWPEISSP